MIVIDLGKSSLIQAHSLVLTWRRKQQDPFQKKTTPYSLIIWESLSIHIIRIFFTGTYSKYYSAWEHSQTDDKKMLLGYTSWQGMWQTCYFMAGNRLFSHYLLFSLCDPPSLAPFPPSQHRLCWGTQMCKFLSTINSVNSTALMWRNVMHVNRRRKQSREARLSQYMFTLVIG